MIVLYMIVLGSTFNKTPMVFLFFIICIKCCLDSSSTTGMVVGAQDSFPIHEGDVRCRQWRVC